jgi:surface protein
MIGTFYGCSLFNQSLDSWDVSKVRDMDYMLFKCSAFDQPLSGWKSKVSSVVSMQGMFTDCTMFNRPLDWDTRSCTNFSHMFDGAASLASEIRLDMTSAVDAGSVFRIMHGTTNDAALSVLNAKAIVSAAPDIQWALAPAAQQHMTCLVCKDRLARYAPPCGHVVLCKECAGKSRESKEPENAKRRKDTMRCPLSECSIEFDGTTAFLVNRTMRDDDKDIPINEDTCGVCLNAFPILAHKTCGGSYCRTCWSKILDGSGKCPSCSALVTVNDISRTFFGLPGKTRARAYKKRGLATSTT